MSYFTCTTDKNSNNQDVLIFYTDDKTSKIRGFSIEATAQAKFIMSIYFDSNEKQENWFLNLMLCNFKLASTAIRNTESHLTFEISNGDAIDAIFSRMGSVELDESDFEELKKKIGHPISHITLRQNTSIQIINDNSRNNITQISNTGSSYVSNNVSNQIFTNSSGGFFGKTDNKIVEKSTTVEKREILSNQTESKMCYFKSILKNGELLFVSTKEDDAIEYFCFSKNKRDVEIKIYFFEEKAKEEVYSWLEKLPKDSSFYVKNLSSLKLKICINPLDNLKNDLELFFKKISAELDSKGLQKLRDVTGIQNLDITRTVSSTSNLSNNDKNSGKQVIQQNTAVNNVSNVSLEKDAQFLFVTNFNTDHLNQVLQATRSRK